MVSLYQKSLDITGDETKPITYPVMFNGRWSWLISTDNWINTYCIANHISLYCKQVHTAMS